MVAFSGFNKADMGLDMVTHPVLNVIYYTLTEILPAAWVLYILRKLPPKRTTQQGYQQVRMLQSCTAHNCGCVPMLVTFGVLDPQKWLSCVNDALCVRLCVVPLAYVPHIPLALPLCHLARTADSIFLRSRLPVGLPAQARVVCRMPELFAGCHACHQIEHIWQLQRC